MRRLLMFATVFCIVAFGYAAGLKVAMLVNGAPNDLGFGYAVNMGRVKVERDFGIKNIYLEEYVDTTEKTVNAVNNLVRQGYDLIFGTTSLQNAGMMASAVAHPNVSFVFSTGVPENYTNLARGNYETYQVYYIMGYFAGLMTQNNKVGIVTPGPKTFSLNAFAIGLSRSNPAATLYSVKTAAFFDPDRATGASQILLGKGVDFLSCQQDDFTVQQVAIQAGINTTGVTVDLSKIFGQDVAMSVTLNWEVLFSHYINLTLSGKFDGSPKGNTLFGFREGMFSVAGFSFYTPESTVNATLAEAAKLVDDGFYYIWCDPLVLSLNPQDKNGTCLSPTQVNTGTTPLTTIVQLGTYIVPVSQSDSFDSYETAIIVVAVISLAASLAALVCVFVFRDRPAMRNSSPMFVAIIVSGAATMQIGALIRAFSTNGSTEICHASVWMAGLGFSAMFGFLLAKNYRIMLIFGKTLKFVRMGAAHVVGIGAAFVAVEILILGVWSGVGDVGVEKFFDVDGIGKYNYIYECTENNKGNTAIYVLISYNLAVLVFGCVLAYKTRDADDLLGAAKSESTTGFSESSNFGATIYTFTMCSIVTIIVIFSVDGYWTKTAIYACMLSFASLVSCWALVGPKIVENKLLLALGYTDKSGSSSGGSTGSTFAERSGTR